MNRTFDKLEGSDEGEFSVTVNGITKQLTWKQIARSLVSDSLYSETDRVWSLKIGDSTKVFDWEIKNLRFEQRVVD